MNTLVIFHYCEKTSIEFVIITWSIESIVNTIQPELDSMQDYQKPLQSRHKLFLFLNFSLQ